MTNTSRRSKILKIRFWTFEQKKLKMKVHIDDSEQILRELVSLYMELPEDLRTTDELIPASHLIFEAKE